MKNYSENLVRGRKISRVRVILRSRIITRSRKIQGVRNFHLRFLNCRIFELSKEVKGCEYF